jgi:hypothetical protein
VVVIFESQIKNISIESGKTYISRPDPIEYFLVLEEAKSPKSSRQMRLGELGERTPEQLKGAGD